MALTKDQIRELILEAPEILDSPGIEFDEDARRAWAKIVNPQRFVMVPDYILKAWIATLGASRTLVVLAFRQVAYISKCKDPIGEEIAEASIEQLSHWSGLSVGGVHKILSDPGYLTWFVKGIGAQADEAGNVYADRDRRSYRVRIDLPLTPEDQYKLRSYLEKHAPSADEDWPLVLYDAPKARKNKVPKKATLPDSPKTVQEMVKELRGPDRPLTRTIDEACVELYEQWAHPGYFGRATHYFMTRWVPELSSSVACLILWARRRAYLDSQLEEVRFMRLDSNQELADAIGVSSRTVSRIKKDPLNSLFLSFSDEEQRTGILQFIDNKIIEVGDQTYRLSPSTDIESGLEFGDPVRLTLETREEGSASVLSVESMPDPVSESQKKQAVRMRVRVSDPIHPEDWKRYESLLDIDDEPRLWSRMNAGWSRVNNAWSKVNDSSDNSEYGANLNESPPSVNDSLSEVNDDATEVKSDRTDLKDSRSEPNALKESLTGNFKSSIKRDIKQLQQDVVVVHNKGWNIESILRNGMVKKLDRLRILDEWLSRGLEFIAHLLFGLSQETINAPVLFAASRFLNRDEPASEFLELAQMEPVSLAIELRRSRYETGWGDQIPFDALAQNNAYEKLVRLEGFVFGPDIWEEEVSDGTEDQGEIGDKYVQLSFVEDGNARQIKATDLWEKVKTQLEQDLPTANYEKWVRDSIGIDFDNNILTIGAEDEYAREWMEDRLTATARRVVTGINTMSLDVQFVVIEVGEIE